MTISFMAGRRIQCLSTDTSEVAGSSLVDDTSSTYTVTKSTTGSWASYSSVGNYTSDLTGNETEYEIRYKLNIGAIAYHGGGSEARECRHHEFFTENGTANSQSGGTNYIMFGIETVPWQTDGFLMTVGNSGGTTTARFNTYTNSNIPTGDYWIKIVRDATTITIGIYSNSDYSTLIEEQSVTRVPTGIRYFKMDSHNNYSGFVGGGVTATVTDITISSLSTTAFPSTTLNTSQSGSRLEVTDTRKIYYLDSSYVVSSDGLGSSGNGTNNGATTGATGKIGSYSYSFDGSNDYIASISSDLGNTWSISLWVKGQSASQGVGYWQIFGKGGADNNEEVNLGAYSTILDLEWSSGNFTTNISTVDDGNWHHMVIIFDAGVTNGTKWYIDNSLIQQATISGASTRSTQLTIGKLGRSFGSGDYFRGYIDEFALFGRALNSTEIGQLYNSGTGKSIPQAITDHSFSTSNLKLYYTFEETSGNLINKAVTSAVWTEEA